MSYLQCNLKTIFSVDLILMLGWLLTSVVGQRAV